MAPQAGFGRTYEFTDLRDRVPHYAPLTTTEAHAFKVDQDAGDAHLVVELSARNRLDVPHRDYSYAGRRRLSSTYRR